MRKLIFWVIIFSLFFSPFCFSKGEKVKKSKNESRFEEFSLEMKKTWNKEVLPILKKIEKEGKKIWIKIESLFKKEVKKRSPQVKKEFKIKTEMVKKDVFQIFRKIKEKIINSLKKK
jgi:histidinol dehydrogenase